MRDETTQTSGPIQELSNGYGYGTWEVCCPKCGNKRMIRGHKFKNSGNVRGSEHMCHPCRAVLLSRRIECKCPRCGLVRNLRRGDANQRITKFCVRCVKQTYLIKDTSDRHLGKTSRGYALVLGMTGHPLAKRNSVHQHWLTLYEEHAMGKESVVWFRNQGFTIHHKNGIRDDNTLENLELRAPGKHPSGWTIEDMEEVILRYRNSSTDGD